MQITRTLSIIELCACLLAVSGVFYGLKLRHDAVLDVRARHAGHINSGRETLAKLLVVTTTLLTLCMALFLIVALSASFSPPNPNARPSSYFIQLMIVAAEACVAVTLWYKQRVRRRVYLRDVASEELREKAAAMQAVELQEANTAALERNTAATEAATHALQNGPMAAQIAQTEATTDLTTATNENSDVIRISTEVELKKLEDTSDGS